MTYEEPFHSWNCIGPLVVLALKFGTVSPKCKVAITVNKVQHSVYKSIYSCYGQTTFY